MEKGNEECDEEPKTAGWDNLAQGGLTHKFKEPYTPNVMNKSFMVKRSRTSIGRKTAFSNGSSSRLAMKKGAS